ncbi:MAG: M48 family metallopeptidase [Candidatus Obscuribacterales bacterium]|nr:M48 family metallopeptidase [Steroidobacteraceae bacterium]
MTGQLPLFAITDRRDPWTVRTSPRARRLSVRVYPGGRVEIVVPPGASPGIVQRFIGEHRRWIDERVRDFAAREQLDTSPPSCIDLPAIERRYVVDYLERDSRPRVESLPEHRLLVIGSGAETRAVTASLRRWLVIVAAHELDAQLRAVAREFDFDFVRSQIRRQRTRWGSCSVRGTISLNVCLLFLDPAVVRYLMIHELCHTRHMNHSARFWNLVEVCEPDYLRLDRALMHSWQQVPWWMFA